MNKVKSGLDVLEQNISQLAGKKTAVLCHGASVNSRIRHIVEILLENGIKPAVIMAPEHGIFGSAQDMETVHKETFSNWNIPIISLYGSNFKSLAPPDSVVDETDLLLCDLQDVGSRYYTYVWTIYMSAEKYLKKHKKVIIADRPNPINGISVEGNLPEKTHLSFVGFKPLPNRHALTTGEIINRFLGHYDELEIIKMQNWTRDMWFEDTGLPWVMPSPNMPSVETATLYPGLCLLEGTNLSEGRGTTKPFEIIGAPFINAKILADELNSVENSGYYARPLKFKPMFQKHAGTECEGVQLHITDRNKLNAYLLGLRIVSTVIKYWKQHFKWRKEAYEFVEHISAFNLLTGNDITAKKLLEGVPPEEIISGHSVNSDVYFEEMKDFLLYPTS